MSGKAASRRKSGLAAEAAAESFLVTKGYLPLARNHVVRGGEIDLVLAQGECVVFVEVRRRRRGAAVGAFESVTQAKQKRIVKAAVDYLARAGLTERPVRFDVVAVTPAARGTSVFDHLENAFDAAVADPQEP